MAKWSLERGVGEGGLLKRIKWEQSVKGGHGIRDSSKESNASSQIGNETKRTAGGWSQPPCAPVGT
jgi:hypothetical protein